MNRIPTFRWLILLLVSWLGFASAWAQVTVTGKVVDANAETLIGVNVLVKNSTSGTITDMDGSFTLEVPDAYATLVFSYIGYTSQEIPLGGRTNLEVILREESQLLNEVVVVGYGTQRKSDLTGSVGSVKSEELQKIAAANVTQALQGKIAGVQVTSASGRPGEGPVVRIRGTGTLNGASPIYVVDGLILDNIDFLNAADIESMEVLKDASAAAIYGTRGANGVVLITTRKGSRGQRARFNFSSYAGVQQVDRTLALTNGTEYAQLVNEIATNNNGRPPFADPTIFGAGTNWQDVIFRDAMMQSYNLNVSGGSEAMTYSISGDAFLQDGIIRSSYFNRYSLRINNEYNLIKGLKFGHNVAFVNSNNNNEPGGIVFNAYAADPTAPAVDDQGKFGNTSANSNVSNPAAQLEYNAYNRGYGQQLTGNAYAEVYPLKDFTFRSSMGFNLFNNRSKSFEPQFFVNDKQQNPESRLFVGYNRANDWQWENTVNFQRDFGKQRINLLAGYTLQSRGGESFGGSRNRLIGDTEDFYYLNAGDAQTATNYSIGFTPERYESFLFRANYALRDKYLLTVSLRRDGSSKFGSERRYGTFPSVAVAWRAIEEPFLKNQDLITNLKIRASWGRLGNDKIPSSAAVPTVTNNLSAVFGPDEALVFGASLITLANPFLQWEETTSTNLGVDLGFLDNRLTLELDYYQRQTKQILVPVPIPDYVGSSGNPYVNAADVLNRGIDFQLNYQGKIGKLGYSIGALGSTVYNEVQSLGTTNNALRDVSINGEFATLTNVGQAIGSFYGYQVAGIYQNAEDIANHPNASPVKPGDLRFADINNDGIINTQDRTFLGSPIPKLIYGFNLGVDIAGFDFSADFNGVSGNKILNAKKMFRGFGIPNFESSFLDRWTGAGSSTTEPRITNGGYPNFVVSDHFLEDGSFLRLRSMQIGYTLPKATTQRLGISNLRVYVSGNNLFTWTDYSGYTPEVASENVLQVGVDRGIYPIARTLLAGINLSF
ncbi:MAG: TonB-dependent receptor [Lewinellaceae bacterium]|nr:TonB-dependent receptor [Lewinellaceae bacterium]